MNKYLLILKEIGITLLIISVIVAVNVLIFNKSYPNKLEVPLAKEYAKIERSRYSVVGDIQDAQNATETFATSPNQLEQYQTEIRYVPGTTNPFVSSPADTDLPGSTVSSLNDENASEDTTNTNAEENTANAE